MIQSQVISALLNTIANVGHLDSQRYATNLLLVNLSIFTAYIKSPVSDIIKKYLLHNFEYVVIGLCDQMGRNFFDLIEVSIILPFKKTCT